MSRRFLGCFAAGLLLVGRLADAAPPTNRQAPLRSDSGPAEASHEFEATPASYFEPGVEPTCDSCGVGGGGGCEGCECDGICTNKCDCPRGFWGRTEYLYWWVKGSELPPLVTTSPNGTAAAAAGVLPGASILFGNSRDDQGGRSGGRVTIGYWFDECETVGADFSFFGLQEGNTDYTASSLGNPILARPFNNAQTGLPDAGLVAFITPLGAPDIAGTISVQTSTQIIGGELNARKTVRNDGCVRLDLLGGYRFFRLDDSVRIRENTTSTDPVGNIPLGTTIGIQDDFGAENQFHGGQIGAVLESHNGRFGWTATGKLGFGNMRQDVAINGSTVVTVPGVAPAASDGGFLALGTNSGLHSRDRFSFLPELGLNLNYQLNCIWKANFGYTLMYVTNVARAGEQIDTTLDPRNFPPIVAGATARPGFAFQESDLWLHGINVGLEARF